jgi:hypothetical protein
MSASTGRMKQALCNIEAALPNGPGAEAELAAALRDAWGAFGEIAKTKTAAQTHQKAVSKATTADEVECAEACDRITAAVAALPPVAAPDPSQPAVVGGIFDGALWQKLIANLPAILAIFRDLFS